MMFELLATVALAQTPTSVPMVQAADFKVGRSWTWDYFDSNGKTYSTERYEVLSQNGDVVLLELSSSYDGGERLTPHHRIEANVASCVRSYSNPVQKKPWSFKMYSRENGRWVPFDPGKTLAFEEKFNCNPNVTGGVGANYETVFATIDGESVFQQKLWRKLESSWFSMTGQERGIAFRKTFASDPAAPFVFVRRHGSTP